MSESNNSGNGNLGKIGDFFSNIGDSISDSTETTQVGGIWVTLMIIIPIIAVFMDAFRLGFNRTASSLTYAILMYLAVSVIFFLTNLFGGLHQEKTVGEIFTPLGVALLISLIQLAVPYFAFAYLPTLFPSVYGILIFVVLLFSPWLFSLIFILKIDVKFIHVLRAIWIVILVVLVIFFMMGSIITNARAIASTTSLDVSPQEAFITFWNQIKQELGNIKTQINESINVKLHPESAKSSIDKNSKMRLGVYIDQTSIDLMQSILYAGKRIDIRADLAYATLRDKISVQAGCYAIDINDPDINDGNSLSHRIPGNIDYSEFDVYGEDKRTLVCSFDNPMIVAKGNYNAYFETKFNFETWAYIDYTFVEETLKWEYFYNGLDINTELNIDKDQVPIFTDGPVKISLIAISQPIGLDLNTTNPTRPQFGIVLENFWKTGKIDFVDEVVVQLPKMLRLTECKMGFGNAGSPWREEDPDTGEKSDYFHYYVFENPLQQSGVMEDIICKLEVNKGMFEEELGLNNKLQKTIVVTARYSYVNEARPTLLRVKENPLLN